MQPISLLHGLLCGLLITAFSWSGTALADEERADETMEVVGEQEAPPSARAESRVTRADLANRPAADLYDALSTVPGVAIEGGPRSSGKTLSIRGFSDTEDVLIRIDGATQNFEKYRYGSGLNIDPSLVKQVDVLRGASTLTQGAGAIGGVVLVETVDAADLLDGDARFGALGRLGYTTNDDGQERNLALYGRPLADLDLLGSVVSRDTHDYELPDGTRLPDSAEGQLSGLLKAEFAREWGMFGIIHRRSDDERLEPFDATGGVAGVGGTVRRATQDVSTVLNGSVMPGWSWLEAEWTLGHTYKNVTDLDSQLAGGANLGTDVFEYRIWTFDIRNVSRIDLGLAGVRFEYGVQGNRETRAARRTNITGTVDNQAQPPGKKETWGAFVSQEISLRELSIGVAARIDQVRVTAKSNSALLLEAQGRATEAAFSRISPAASVSYTPSTFGLTLFYSYFEAFRPPLIDEYFTIGSLSRCSTFSRYVPEPVPPTRPTPPPPDADFAAILDFLLALDAYDAADAIYQAESEAYLSNPNAQINGLCGDDYEPEVARTHEIGFGWSRQNLLAGADFLSLRFSYFDTRVSNVLESIFQNSVTGEISQPGEESRRGVEFSFKYDSPQWFLDLSLSTLGGYTDLRYYVNNGNPIVAEVTTPADQGPQALRDIPGDRIAFTFGRRFFAEAFEIGYRFSAIDARLVTTGFRAGCPGGFFVLPACTLTGERPGYVLHGAYARWSVNRWATLRISAENLANRAYELPGFQGGIGTLAPGRDVRMTLELRY